MSTLLGGGEEVTTKWEVSLFGYIYGIIFRRKILLKLQGSNKARLFIFNFCQKDHVNLRGNNKACVFLRGSSKARGFFYEYFKRNICKSLKPETRNPKPPIALHKIKLYNWLNKLNTCIFNFHCKVHVNLRGNNKAHALS